MCWCSRASCPPTLSAPGMPCRLLHVWRLSFPAGATPLFPISHADPLSAFLQQRSHSANGSPTHKGHLGFQNLSRSFSGRLCLSLPQPNPAGLHPWCPQLGSLAELRQLKNTGFPCQTCAAAQSAREARLLTKLPAFLLNVKTSFLF